jgi:hypothetical protein
MVVGDIPPPPVGLALFGWLWPQGPFCMPLRISRSPMSASLGAVIDVAQPRRVAAEREFSGASLARRGRARPDRK